MKTNKYMLIAAGLVLLHGVQTQAVSPQEVRRRQQIRRDNVQLGKAGKIMYNKATPIMKKLHTIKGLRIKKSDKFSSAERTQIDAALGQMKTIKSRLETIKNKIKIQKHEMHAYNRSVEDMLDEILYYKDRSSDYETLKVTIPANIAILSSEENIVEFVVQHKRLVDETELINMTPKAVKGRIAELRKSLSSSAKEQAKQLTRGALRSKKINMLKEIENKIDLRLAKMEVLNALSYLVSKELIDEKETSMFRGLLRTVR